MAFYEFIEYFKLINPNNNQTKIITGLQLIIRDFPFYIDELLIDKPPQTILCFLCRCNFKLPIIKFWIENAQPCIDKYDANFLTPLHWAIITSRLSNSQIFIKNDIIEYLLDNGADRNAGHGEYVNRSPFTEAIRTENIDIARSMFQRGHVSFPKYIYPTSPMWIVVKYNLLKSCEFLLQIGANFGKITDPQSLVYCILKQNRNNELKQLFLKYL